MNEPTNTPETPADSIRSTAYVVPHEMIDTLIAERDRLRAENAELLRDRARLDWLEARTPTIGFKISGWTNWIVGGNGQPTVRAAIDAALAKHAATPTLANHDKTE